MDFHAALHWRLAVGLVLSAGAAAAWSEQPGIDVRIHPWLNLLGPPADAGTVGELFAPLAREAGELRVQWLGDDAGAGYLSCRIGGAGMPLDAACGDPVTRGQA